MSKGLLQGHKIKISQIIKNAGKTNVGCVDGTYFGPIFAKYIQLIDESRGGGTGCSGWAMAHPIFDKLAIETSFQQEKEFWRSGKNLPS